MATRERAIDRADLETRRAVASIGREIREGRRAAGISQAFVASNVGISHTHVSRLERGLVASASIRVLARLCWSVGLELAVRAYPGGDALRDAAQVRLLERLRRHLHPRLGWRAEVPLPIAGDRRAWDAVISGPSWSVAVEAETRLSDLQALLRRLELKRRDGGIEHLILLLADTRTNRSALRAARPTIEAAFPVPQASVIASLASAAHLGGSAIGIL